MSEKRLLTGFQPLDVDAKAIRENREANGGKIVLRGIMQRADAVNQNGRIYPKYILEREIENYQKFIKERRALGELDHAENSIVNLQNVSHLITEMRWDGDEVVGSIELLDTPMGKIAQTLVESGVKLGISSRGVGSTKKQGDYDLVDEDFVWITADLVSEPSTSNAFMLRESLVKNPFEGLSRTDRMNRTITELLAALKR